MAVKNAIYQVDNGSGFDEIHFKTKAAQVMMANGKTAEVEIADILNKLTTADLSNKWWKDAKTGLIIQIGHAYFQPSEVYVGREYYVRFPIKFPTAVMMTIPIIEPVNSWQYKAYTTPVENFSARNLWGSSYFLDVKIEREHDLNLRVLAIGF